MPTGRRKGGRFALGGLGMARHMNDDKVRLLRSLAFKIHRKEIPAEALNDCFEAEGKGGKHRQWRQAVGVLAEDGFVPALLAGELIGAEAAVVMTVLERAKDHRLLSDAIEGIADFLENAES
ncbi:MAG: hypothetical protein HYU59_11215 [Magnetospirillum gryphiswaldense]|nr:hypothetical protein [Magnetospirillum gryphiswaldense]